MAIDLTKIAGVAALCAAVHAGNARAEAAFSLELASTVLPVRTFSVVQAVYAPGGAAGSLPPASAPPQLIGGAATVWSSSAPGVVAVDSSGHLLGLRRGSAVITGSYKGRSASMRVKVAGALRPDTLTMPHGLVRSYSLYVPDALPAGPRPLVLVFHGGTGTGQTQMLVSQMNAAADRHKFLVAYPDGIGKSWNGGACCNPAAALGVDDVGFVSLLIDSLVASDGVDARRVYATGLSNGAIFSHRLACQLSDKIAAIAPVAGGLNVGGDFDACEPSRPVPVLAFHGTTDEHYPYEGGDGAQMHPAAFIEGSPRSIPDTIADWLAFDGIDPGASQVVYQKGIETCVRHRSEGTVAVTLCTAAPPAGQKDLNGIAYDGGGHVWPGGWWFGGQDFPTPDIDASERIARFFGEYSIEPSSTPALARCSFQCPQASPYPAVVFDGNDQTFSLGGQGSSNIEVSGNNDILDFGGAGSQCVAFSGTNLTIIQRGSGSNCVNGFAIPAGDPFTLGS